MAIDTRGSGTYDKLVELVELIVENYEDFDRYQNTRYTNVARPAIFWPDGSSIGYGMASHMSGAAQKFYGKFHYWGFNDLEDFFSLPVQKRNEFLRNGKAIWQMTFREKEFSEKTLDNICCIAKLDNQGVMETLSALTKVEHLYHDKLVEEAKLIKKDCYDDRRLRFRIRNEKARFKAEAKLRARTQNINSGSYLAEELIFSWFRFQELIKQSIGLRE